MTTDQAASTFLADAGSVAWPLDDHMRAEFERFVELGFPSARSETWRNTPTRALAALTDQLLYDDGLRDADDSVELDRLLGIFPALRAIDPQRRIVFRNGLWLPEPTALALQPLQRTSVALGAGDSPLAALNGARAAQTLHLQLGPSDTDASIHIVHVLDGDAPLLAAPRLEIDAAPGATADIVEYFLQVPGSAPVLNTAVTALKLGADATVRFRRLQLLKDNAHSVAEARIGLDTRACLDWFTLDIGAALARNDIHVDLLGQDADAGLAGVFAMSARQHVDNRLEVRHAVANATSRQTYAGLAGGRSKAVYHGKVIVAEGADGTKAFQRSRNLLLGPGAEVFARPELEIYADEVECAHGATTGQLDADALFYLRARGLSETDARRLLISAFVASALEPLGDTPVARKIDEALGDKLNLLLPEIAA